MCPRKDGLDGPFSPNATRPRPRRLRQAVARRHAPGPSARSTRPCRAIARLAAQAPPPNANRELIRRIRADIHRKLLCPGVNLPIEAGTCGRLGEPSRSGRGKSGTTVEGAGRPRKQENDRGKEVHSIRVKLLRGDDEATVLLVHPSRSKRAARRQISLMHASR